MSFSDQRAAHMQSAPSSSRIILAVPHVPNLSCHNLPVTEQPSGSFKPLPPAHTEKTEKWIPSRRAGVTIEKLTSLQAYYLPPRDTVGNVALFGSRIKVTPTQVKPVVQLSVK